MDIRPGDIVFGSTESEKYQVVELIDAGRFGVVYKLLDLNRNPFALKTISTAVLDEDGLRILKNEGRLATEVRHPNVLSVFFFHDGTNYTNLPPYMIMEYADGGTLAQILTAHRRSGQIFSIEELQTMFSQLASGMKAINEKLVHRDIKPDNILIVNGKLKISDFGLSKIVGALTRSQTLKGINHIRYCAPEAWNLDRNMPAMDMYSMGIVFYELATLTNPYTVDESGDIVNGWRHAHLTRVPDYPLKYNPNLPVWLVQLVMKMMSKRPQDRYTSWDEVIKRCEETKEIPIVSPNVSDLVQHAIDSYHQEEQERLHAEDEMRKHQEFTHSIVYCFQEITAAVEQIVTVFNKESDFAKLKITKLDPLFFLILASNKSGPVIEVNVFPTQEGHKLGDKIVKAWGWARSHTGRGFNLILVANKSDDLYGEWITLHVNHRQGMKVSDNRPDPFPFDVTELPGEIQLLNAAHIYVTNKIPFSPAMFNALIKELL